MRCLFSQRTTLASLRSLSVAAKRPKLSFATLASARVARLETKIPKPVSDMNVAASKVRSGQWKFAALEKEFNNDHERAILARRHIVEQLQPTNESSLQSLPYQHFDYNAVHGQCCENVIGYVAVPVGVAGPLNVDGKEYYIPLATTEGALIASTSRGCKAITQSGGVNTEILADSMSRAPVVQVKDAHTAARLRSWVSDNFASIQHAFNRTSRFARLVEIQTYVAGRKVFLRFKCRTGDAMGMNMCSKGVEEGLRYIQESFGETIDVLALSGNVCTDKKPSALNWTDGRGKSVVADCVVKGSVVRSVLKTTVQAMSELNYAKNLVGSSIAGSIGGMNAQASNLVTAVFIATGQDAAQNIESSTCITLMEPINNGEDLYVSVSMPSIEVGTVGGGTHLPGQAACLRMLGCFGANHEKPGANAQHLARIVASTVMAGELSLMAALSTGHLMKAHVALNRHKVAAISQPIQPRTTIPQTPSETLVIRQSHSNEESVSISSTLPERLPTSISSERLRRASIRAI